MRREQCRNGGSIKIAMGKENKFICNRIKQLSGIDMVCWKKEEVEQLKEDAVWQILDSKKLRNILMQGVQNQAIPFIYQDKYQVCFICIHCGSMYYAAGPICVTMLGRVELHQFYRQYGIDEVNEKWLKMYTVAQLLAVTAIIAKELTGREYTDEELLYGNHIVEEGVKKLEKEQITFEFQESDDGIYHHTYNEERKLLDCIREGLVDEAVRYSMKMDMNLGKMSKRELNHWKNAAIAAITLCTRTAIEGGISPSVAYRLSDFYIQKNDGFTEIAQVVDNRNRAVKDLTQCVKKKRETRSSSNYVEHCKDYVEKNYRHKIYIDDVAEELGISTSYLSRLFHETTGTRFQDYVVRIRVEHAANLLMYSEEPIAKIAEYVNFPSQSYFGKVFKQYKQMSPKRFREARKPSGF